MSNYLLFHEAKKFRIELIFGCEERFEKPQITKLLLAFSERLIKTQIAPYLGNVFDFNDYIYPGSRMTKLYITNPSLYHADLHVFNNSGTRISFP